jgi:hypothetical protein
MSVLRDTNLVLSMAPLDPAMDATPQEFADEMLRRMVIKSTSDFYQVIRQDSKPLYDQGALILPSANGSAWYLWDEHYPGYLPVDITPSLGIQTTGKWILTSNAGVWQWTSVDTFSAFIGFSAASIPAGRDYQILGSISNVAGWHNFADLVPDGTVDPKKMATTGATSGDLLTVVSGVPTWKTPDKPVKIYATPEFNMPSTLGTSVEVDNPAGTKVCVARCVAVCKTATDGYLAGDELNVECIQQLDIDSSNHDIPLFAISIGDSKINVAFAYGGDGWFYPAKGGGSVPWPGPSAGDKWTKMKVYLVA